jgi:hypothetical protein
MEERGKPEPVGGIGNNCRSNIKRIRSQICTKPAPYLESHSTIDLASRTEYIPSVSNFPGRTRGLTQSPVKGDYHSAPGERHPAQRFR